MSMVGTVMADIICIIQHCIFFIDSIPALIMSHIGLHRLLGQIYGEDELKDFKEQIELQTNTKLSKSTKNDDIAYVCKYAYLNNCNFMIRFAKRNSSLKFQQGTQPKNNANNLLQIVEINANHNPDCFHSFQESQFYKNRKLLIDCRQKMSEIIRNTFKNEGKELSPAEIMEKLASELGRSRKFIYEGFQQNTDLKRQIKKKFDNLVAQIKKACIPQPSKQSKRRNKQKWTVRQGNGQFSLVFTKKSMKPEQVFEHQNSFHGNLQQMMESKNEMSNCIKIQQYPFIKLESPDFLKSFPNQSSESKQKAQQYQKIDSNDQSIDKKKHNKVFKFKRIHKQPRKGDLLSKGQEKEDSWQPGKSAKSDFGFIE